MLFFIDFFDTTRVAQLNMISPLFSIPGFGVDSLHLDAMHILDLGATQYIAGSTLTALVENNFARSTKARGLKHELPFPKKEQMQEDVEHEKGSDCLLAPPQHSSMIGDWRIFFTSDAALRCFTKCGDSTTANSCPAL